MGNLYEDLESLCEIVSDKIAEATGKIDENLTGGDVEYLDKLTHMLKSIKTTMAMMDSESGDYSGDYDSRSGSYDRERSGRRYYSGARGRSARTGRYVSRTGRMSRRSSGDDEMVSELRDLMEDAPDDRTRQEFQKFIQKIEQM